MDGYLISTLNFFRPYAINELPLPNDTNNQYSQYVVAFVLLRDVIRNCKPYVPPNAENTKVYFAFCFVCDPDLKTPPERG